jgi:hypothetical protein
LEPQACILSPPLWTVPAARLCSHEHEDTIIPFLGAVIAQIHRQTSTTGAGFMDSALDALIFALTSISDQVDSVLRKIDNRNEKGSLAWKCIGCGNIKHFTRPALAEVAAPCPNCGGEAFDPV